jgi:NosR/NirI family nitrite reductase transcriptional regulator
MRIGPQQRTWRTAFAMALGLIAFSPSFEGAQGADLSVAKEFFPPDSAISVERVSGSPPAAELRTADGQIAGYAFSTHDVAGSVGYSGRPIDIVAAVTADGIVTGAKIVAHEEPILVIGIPREAIAAYVANFKGFDVRSGVISSKGQASRAPQGVAGASITSAVIRDAIVRSARAVLRSRIAPADKVRIDRENQRRSSWPALVAEGAIRHLLVTRGQAAQLLGTHDDEPDKTYIELWLAVATPSAIGESLLGQRTYESELAKIGDTDNLVLVAANGLYSFRGTNWRRTGIFDRVEIVQGDKTVRLRAADHVHIDRFSAPGAPEFREISLFRVSASTAAPPRRRNSRRQWPFRWSTAFRTRT